MTVDVGDWRDPSVPLISWDPANPPENLASARFRMRNAQSGGLLKKDDGLYLMRGMMLIIR